MLTQRKPSFGINYSCWKQIKAIFRLLFFIFITDRFALVLLFFFPLLLSTIWILLVEQSILPEIPNTYVFNDVIKRWYEFSFFAIGLTGLFYTAIKFNQFRRTLLFQRILIGGINKVLLSFLLLLFYWIVTIFLLSLKIGLLFYYPQFRSEIKNANVFGLILGFLLFSITSVSIAFFIAFLPIRSTITVSVISVFLLFFFLLISGIIIDIEVFLINFSELRKERWLPQSYIDHWETINSKSKVWRGITFISPYQPSINIVKNAHADGNWKTPLEILGRGSNPFESVFYRPMIYDSYLQASAVNVAWIIGFCGLGSYFLQRSK